MKKSGFGKTMRLEWQLYVYLAPAVILLLIFAYLPLVGVVIAFQDFIPSGGMKGFFTSEWVGLDNFKYIFGMRDFRQVLSNTLIISVAKIAAGIVAPLLLALLLNEVRRQGFKKAVQALIYIPYFLSWVVLGGILVDILSPSGGIVNTVIKALGGKPVFFLGNGSTIRATLIVSDVWKGCGYNMVIFLAALTGIDPWLYESAQMDGAGYFKRMQHITLPSILPTVILLSVLGLGNILNAGFDQIFNLYSPAVYKQVDIIDTFVYRLGMMNLQYSVSTAVGLFKSVISFVLITASFWMAKKFANYRIF